MKEPSIRYQVRALSLLTLVEREALRKLCFQHGRMIVELTRNVAHAVLAYRGPTIVGWLCLSKELELDDPENIGRIIIRCDVYVNPKYRRRHIGSQLIEEGVVLSQFLWPHCEILQARPHDDRSREFFSRLPVGYLRSPFRYQATLPLYTDAQARSA